MYYRKPLNAPNIIAIILYVHNIIYNIGEPTTPVFRLNPLITLPLFAYWQQVTIIRTDHVKACITQLAINSTTEEIIS